MTSITTNGDVINSRLTQEELEVIYNFIKRFFLGLLKQVKPKDLIYYIQNNKAPNLMIYFDLLPKKITKNLKILKNENSGIIDKYMNTDQILKYSKEEIPKLYEIFATVKGKKWLSALIRVIKKSIF